MRSDQQRQYQEFVAARGQALRQAAYLLCGNWHEAEDLTQTALTKLYLAWRSVRMETAEPMSAPCCSGSSSTPAARLPTGPSVSRRTSPATAHTIEVRVTSGSVDIDGFLTSHAPSGWGR